MTSSQSTSPSAEISEPMSSHFASIQRFGTDLPNESPGRVLHWFRQIVTLLAITAFHATLSFSALAMILIAIRGFFFAPGLSLIGMLGLSVAAIAAITVGAFQMLIVTRYEEYPFHWLLARRLRRVIAKRRHAIVEPRDVSSRFCEVVPKDRWKLLRMETAADLVYVRIDEDGVWMEGDRQRYHFPPKCILGAMPQSFSPAGGWTQLHAAMIYVRTMDGPEEIPVIYRDFSFAEMGSGERRRQRDQMVEAVCEIARGSEYEPISMPEDVRELAEPAGTDSLNPYAPPRMVSHTGA